MGFQKNVFLLLAAVTLVMPAFAHADEFAEFNSMGVNHRSSRLSDTADSNYDRIESEIKGFSLAPPQVRKAKRAPASDPMFDRATNQKVDPVAEDHLADRDIDSFMRDQDQAEKDARDEYNRVHHIKAASKARIAHRKLSRRNVSTLSNKASLLGK